MFSIFEPKRRAISSIVGGMIFLILMSTGVSVYFLAVQSQSDVIDTQKIVLDSGIKKIQENYAISASIDKNNNNRLAIQVKNQGINPVEVANIWIVNKTDVINEYPAKKYSIIYDDRYIPGGYGKNILENQPLYLLPNDYDIKVISVLGAIKKTDLSVNGNNDLKVELYAIPPDVRTGENVTIAMHVTNTGDIPITNVTPYDPPTVIPQSAVMVSQLVSPLPISLDPKESSFFTWHLTLNGTVGTKVKFSSNASGIDENGLVVRSNNSFDKVTIRDDKGGGDLIVLTQDLLARPELFLISPSPQGDSSSKALWGINIVNPTNATMEVSKLTLTAFAPGANNNDKIFATPCAPESISPSGSTGWVCATENTVMWKDTVSPEIIPPFSVKPFLVKVLPGTIPAANNNLEAIIVHTSVFTTVGSFGKAGYETTMYDGDESIMNVYLSNQIDSRANADIQSTRTGIPSGSTQFFNIVLADLDNLSSTKLKLGAKLIINVPKGWTDVSIDTNAGFVDPPTVTQFADGSSQIIAQTTGELGNGANEADTIRFSAKSPDVTNEQMYVMYVLAEGETNNDFLIGPLTEIVLQVKP